LIEALPPVLTDDHATVGLACYPRYDEAHRHAPEHIRYHLIQNSLRCFIPLDIHLDLQRRFSCLIRVGYAGRNPLAAEFWKRLAGAFKTFDQYGEQLQLPNEASKAAGFNIIGIIGVGKSLSVERILNLYPQTKPSNSTRPMPSPSLTAVLSDNLNATWMGHWQISTARLK
jgi:hypothetical protein